MSRIRDYIPQDWPCIWRLIEPVFRDGSTYAFSPEISEREARTAWVEVPLRTYVCEDETEKIVGTYYLKPNQPALGAHVCNCGYIVAESSRGKGIGSALCLHSQAEARRTGFAAMQFNLVVATNEAAIRLWKQLGFTVVGVLPKAFNHRAFGYVDALVMYKQLGT